MKKVTNPPRISVATVDPRSEILKNPSRPGRPPAVVCVLMAAPNQNGGPTTSLRPWTSATTSR